MKKISAGLCMLVVLLPVLITCTFFLHQSILRHQAAEQLEQDHLTIITVSAKDLRWHTCGKELWVQSRLFDVKSIIENASGYYVITGLFDEEEQQLLHQLGDLIDDDESKSRALSNVIQSWMNDLFSHAQTTIASHYLFTKKRGFCDATFSIHADFISSILTPPPQHASMQLS